LEIEVSRTTDLGWPQTAILPISASQVAKITVVTHQHLIQHTGSFSAESTKSPEQVLHGIFLQRREKRPCLGVEGTRYGSAELK
jgi:hypothetical protein